MECGHGLGEWEPGHIVVEKRDSAYPGIAASTAQSLATSSAQTGTATCCTPPQVQVRYGRLEMNTIPGFEQFGLNDQEEYTGHTFLSHTLPGRERLAQLLDQS